MDENEWYIEVAHVAVLNVGRGAVSNVECHAASVSS